MKKLFTFAAIITAAFCLVSCSLPLKTTSSRKNGLDCAFSSEVSITLDRLQAEGNVKRFGAGAWEIEFSSPDSLSGIKLEFSEGNTEASYKGLSFSVPQAALPVKSMMLNLIKAVDDNSKLEELKGEEKENGLEVSGKLEGGEYVLTVDKDGRISSFKMDNNSLEMTFKGLTVIEGKPQQPTETSTVSESTSKTVSATETSAAMTTKKKK